MRQQAGNGALGRVFSIKKKGVEQARKSLSNFEFEFCFVCIQFGLKFNFNDKIIPVLKIIEYTATTFPVCHDLYFGYLPNQ